MRVAPIIVPVKEKKEVKEKKPIKKKAKKRKAKKKEKTVKIAKEVTKVPEGIKEVITTKEVIKPRGIETIKKEEKIIESETGDIDFVSIEREVKRPSLSSKKLDRAINNFEEMIELEKRKPEFIEMKKEAAEWSKGPKPRVSEPPRPQYAFEPTKEEKELMKRFESSEREQEILKPTEEEEKIMEQIREPELIKEIKPTPQEIAYMEREGLTQKKSRIERIKTGIEGIDELTKGGVPKKRAISIVGGPGSGKSILLMQFLVNGATMYGEPGIYITFEEDVEELKSNFSSFNFDINKLERKGLLKIVNYNPMRIKRFIKNMDVTLRDLIKAMQAKRVVIDSLSAFTLLYGDEGEQREGLFELFQTLKNLGVTTLLSTESWREPTITKSGVVEFIADGVIMLYNLKVGDTRVRAVEVLKMRGIEHETRIVPFRITADGIKIFPEEQVFETKKNFSRF